MFRRAPSINDPSGVPGTERLLALSDGVVAIALTLLVLQLKVPTLHGDSVNSPSALARELFHNGSNSFTSYVVSFYVIAQFWLAHHRTFRLVSGHNEGLAWGNFAFLFTITLFPFSSALLGAYPSNPLAVIEFSVNLLLASLSTLVVIEVAKRRNMLRPTTTPLMVRGTRYRGVVTGLVIVLSIAITPFSTAAAKYAWLLLIAVPYVGKWWASAATGDDDPGATDSPTEGAPGGSSVAVEGTGPGMGVGPG